MADRSPEELRRSIEGHRAQLAVSVSRLRGEVAEVSDWRKHLARHQTPVMVGAVVAGFVLGGGVAALGGLLRRRR